MTRPTAPTPTPRSSGFWTAVAITGMAVCMTSTAGIAFATVHASTWLQITAFASTVLGLGAWGYGVHRCEKAEARELDAALSTRYGVPVTRLGSQRWNVGGRNVEAVLRDGPTLHVIGAEPLPAAS